MSRRGVHVIKRVVVRERGGWGGCLALNLSEVDGGHRLFLRPAIKHVGPTRDPLARRLIAGVNITSAWQDALTTSDIVSVK